jgi:hypothetical protein
MDVNTAEVHAAPIGRGMKGGLSQIALCDDVSELKFVGNCARVRAGLPKRQRA